MSGDNTSMYRLRKGKGKVLIFVNDRFVGVTAAYCPDVSKTGEWQKAAADISGFWKEMGYEPITSHNKTQQEIENLVRDVNFEFTADDDCLVLCFVTYGDHGLIYGKDGKVALQKVLQPLKTGHPDLREIILYLTNIHNEDQKKKIAGNLTNDMKKAFKWLVEQLDDGITELQAFIRKTERAAADTEEYREEMKQNTVTRYILTKFSYDWLHIHERMTQLGKIYQILHEVQHAVEGSVDGRESVTIMGLLKDLEELVDDPYRGVLKAMDVALASQRVWVSGDRDMIDMIHHLMNIHAGGRLAEILTENLKHCEEKYRIESKNMRKAFTKLVKKLQDGIAELTGFGPEIRRGGAADTEMYMNQMKPTIVTRYVLAKSNYDWPQINERTTKLTEICTILKQVQDTFKGSVDSKETVMKLLKKLTESVDAPFRGLLKAIDSVPLGGKPKIIIMQTMMPVLQADAGAEAPEIERTIPSEADFFYMWARVTDNKYSFISTLVEQMNLSQQEETLAAEREITTIATRTIQAVERQLRQKYPDLLREKQELPFYMSQLRDKLYIPEYGD